jgi:DNA-binding MarR family transcriptional regulator
VAAPSTTLQLGLLLRVAHARAAKTASTALAPLEIEGRHLGVLVSLAARGPLTQTQLIDTLGSEKSSMVRTVDDLERLGAAVRSPSPGDRRARLVALTPAGRDLLDRAQSRASHAAEELFSVLTDDEQNQLKHLLSRFTGREDQLPA